MGYVASPRKRLITLRSRYAAGVNLFESRKEHGQHLVNIKQYPSHLATVEVAFRTEPSEWS